MRASHYGLRGWLVPSEKKEESYFAFACISFFNMLTYAYYSYCIKIYAGDDPELQWQFSQKIRRFLDKLLCIACVHACYFYFSKINHEINEIVHCKMDLVS